MAQMDYKTVADKAMAGKGLSHREISYLIDTPQERIEELLAEALRIKQRFFANRMGFCCIVNAKSGRCAEDCRFCAQASRHRTGAPEYGLLPTDDILAGARAMREKGVPRYSVVTSGMRLTREELDRLVDVVASIKQMGLISDVSVGFLGKDDLKRLKQAGLEGFHHNLETSRSYFPKVCTTHDYEEDVATVRAALEVGLYVCSGGLFGMGESWNDRVELAMTLKELGVQSVPVNFLHPIQGTAFENLPVLSQTEALKIIALYRFLLPDKHIRVCGGRELVFGADRARVLSSGASGIMVGDYLTTKGTSMDADISDVSRLGLAVDA